MREAPSIRRASSWNWICTFQFSTSGGMGPSTTVTYKRLAFLLSVKWKTPYCIELWAGYAVVSVGFSLLHSAIMCIRGSRSLVLWSPSKRSRSSFHHRVDLALEEGRFEAVWAPPFSFLLLFSCPAHVLFVLFFFFPGCPAPLAGSGRQGQSIQPGKKINLKKNGKASYLRYNILAGKELGWLLCDGFIYFIYLFIKQS